MVLPVNIVGFKVTTHLYEKSLALHVYIPPSSCHLSSYFRSLVTGMVLLIHCLCTFQKDVPYWLKEFYSLLLDRGYQSDQILPLFSDAITNTFTFLYVGNEYRQQQKRLPNHKDNICFHLTFHPCNSQSHTLQTLWRELVLQPPGKNHLNSLRYFNQDRIRASRVILAYSRHPTIGNLLICQNICKRLGLNVTLFLARH